MILFINVFITNKRARVTPDDRFEVFKYMLHRLSLVDRWSKAVIYCKLDSEYEHKEEELRKWCHDLFPNVSFYPDRVMYQKDWQKAAQEVLDYPDDLVWFLGNDDHIVLNNDLIDEAMELVLQDEGNASFYFSHWPEVMRWYAGNPDTKRVGANFVMATRSVTDGIQLVNKKLLRSWWFDRDYGDAEMRRSDDIMLLTPGSECSSPFVANFYAPLKETARHFDGYGHVGFSEDFCMSLPSSFEEVPTLCNREMCKHRPSQGDWVKEHDAFPPAEWFTQ